MWSCCRWGAAAPKTNRLVDLYNGALDAAKKGAKVGTEHEELRHELLHHPGRGMQPGYPEYMQCRAWQSDLVWADGTSNSALGKMWAARHGYPPHPPAAAVDIDPDLSVPLPVCHVCGCDLPTYAMPFHVALCEANHQLRRPGEPVPPPPPRADAEGSQWGPSQRKFYDKWTGVGGSGGLVQRAAMDVMRLGVDGGADGGGGGGGAPVSAAASRRKDEAWRRGYDAICERYRHELLGGYTEEERDRAASHGSARFPVRIFRAPRTTRADCIVWVCCMYRSASSPRRCCSPSACQSQSLTVPTAASAFPCTVHHRHRCTT